MVADIKGNINKITTAISPYRKPATNVHCKLILIQVRTFDSDQNSGEVGLENIVFKKEVEQKCFSVRSLERRNDK